MVEPRGLLAAPVKPLQSAAGKIGWAKVPDRESLLGSPDTLRPVGSILVADDNRGFADLLRATLEEAGYEV